MAKLKIKRKLVTPNNAALFDAAFSGFLSGVYQLSDLSASLLTGAPGVLGHAQLFAQAVDSLISPTTVDTAMATCMFGICQSETAQRYATFNTVAGYIPTANSIVALYNEALTNLVPVGGGGGATGPANAVAYYDGSGNNSGNPELTANQYDAYGRPQIHDYRLGVPSGRGAVYRLGAWGPDGDPEDVISEGFVTYGANALGIGPSETLGGGFGFYEPNGFGELNIIPGVDGGGTFYICGFEDGSPNAPFGLDGFIVNTNEAVPLFQVRRTDGVTYIASAEIERAELSEATNAMQGLAALGVGGIVTIPNTSVDGTSRIIITVQPGPTPGGTIWISAITPGVSFTIQSTNDSDTCNVAWQIWHAGP